MKKLLYVAANSNSLSPLRLDADISAIEKLFLTATSEGERLSTVFLPDLNASEFEQVLLAEKPDILHIAAHGADGRLLIKTGGEAEEWKQLDAKTLNDWLPNPAPNLVFISACDNQTFIEKLVGLGRVPIAIGTDAEVQNQAARAATVTFYARIIAGCTVKEAFDACSAMSSFRHRSAAMVIEPKSEKLGQVVLHQRPLIVARFVRKRRKRDRPRRDRDGDFAFQIGLVGCPAQTSQVIFFTDHADFASNPKKFEVWMSTLVIGTPRLGEFWVPLEREGEDINWYAAEDMRLFATGVNPAGDIFAVRATDLSTALERFYLMANGGVVPSGVQEALNSMLPPHKAEAMFRRGERLLGLG